MENNLNTIAAMEFGRVMERLAKEKQERLRTARAGLQRGGPQAAATLEIELEYAEKSCVALAEIWVGLLEGTNRGVLTRSHVDFIKQQVQGVAAARRSALSDGPGMVSDRQAVAGHVARGMETIVAKVCRDLELRLRRQEIGLSKGNEFRVPRKPATDDSQKSTLSKPVVETREFKFIADGKLRGILERDYAEIQRAYASECWKSVIIVSGSAIEAILLDRLQADAGRAQASSKAPNDPDLRRWDLEKLIEVAVDLCPKLAGVQRLSHSVRGYRNLVHPGNEMRTGLVFGKEEARIALEVLNLVHRELS